MILEYFIGIFYFKWNWKVLNHFNQFQKSIILVNGFLWHGIWKMKCCRNNSKLSNLASKFLLKTQCSLWNRSAVCRNENSFGTCIHIEINAFGQYININSIWLFNEWCSYRDHMTFKNDEIMSYLAFRLSTCNYIRWIILEFINLRNRLVGCLKIRYTINFHNKI